MALPSSNWSLTRTEPAGCYETTTSQAGSWAASVSAVVGVDVVVDGSRLTWDELGHALEPYEGWRFCLVLEDPCDDLRPDADVIAVSSSALRV